MCFAIWQSSDPGCWVFLGGAQLSPANDVLAEPRPQKNQSSEVNAVVKKKISKNAKKKLINCFQGLTAIRTRGLSQINSG